MASPPTNPGVIMGPEGKPTRHTAYTTGEVSLTSGEKESATINIRQGYHFVARKITWRKGARFKFNIFALRDTIFNDKIDCNALVNGDGSGLPYLLDDGYVFPAGTQVRVDFEDQGVASSYPNLVEMVLNGEEWEESPS